MIDDPKRKTKPAVIELNPARSVSRAKMALATGVMGHKVAEGGLLGTIAITCTFTGERVTNARTPEEREREREQRRELYGALGVFGTASVLGAILTGSQEAGALLGLLCFLCCLQAFFND